MKDFADNRINVTHELNFVLGKVNNIVEKLRVCIFFFSHNVFKSSRSNGCLTLLFCSTRLSKTLREKGEIARNKHFLLFPVFSTLLGYFPAFSSNSKLLSAESFNLEKSKFCCLGKG